MIERWLPIARVDGRYEVSDLGRIRCVQPAARGRSSKAPLVPNGSGKRGYLLVQVRRTDGRKMNLRVHTEVLTAFVGPRPAGHEARHLDGDRSNNRASNLAWGTQIENMRDRDRHGRTARGDRVRGGRGRGYRPPLAALQEATR
jgi:hypothetical protein